jgi:cytochrome c oxidase subunit III
VSVAAEAHPQAHTNTGWSSDRFGLFLFIASEAIIFGALFAHYLYNRVSAGAWPPAGTPIDHKIPWLGLPLLLTVILLSSGWTCHNAVEAIKKDRQLGMIGWLSITIVLGVLFIAGQAFEYAQLMAEGLTLGSGVYASTFYGLTGLHGAHVIGGVGLLTAMYARGLAGHFSSRHHYGLEAATMYWHFVDAIWIVLLLAVYIL